MGCLVADIRRFDALHISVGIVCARDIGEKKFLKVTPVEVMWVYPDSVEYTVKCNTLWTVE